MRRASLGPQRPFDERPSKTVQPRLSRARRQVTAAQRIREKPMKHAVLIAASLLVPQAAQAQSAPQSVEPLVPATGAVLDVVAEGRTTRVPTWRRSARAW
jgi:hypothetical protein